MDLDSGSFPFACEDENETDGGGRQRTYAVGDSNAEEAHREYVAEKPCGGIADNEGAEYAAAHSNGGISRAGDDTEEAEHKTFENKGNAHNSEIVRAGGDNCLIGGEYAVSLSGEGYA